MHGRPLIGRFFGRDGGDTVSGKVLRGINVTAKQIFCPAEQALAPAWCSFPPSMIGVRGYENAAAEESGVNRVGSGAEDRVRASGQQNNS